MLSPSPSVCTSLLFFSVSALLTYIILGAKRAWHAGLGKVLCGGANGIATVSPYPLIGYEIGQRINPASGSVDTGMTSVLVLEVSQICIVVLLFGYGDDIIFRRFKVVNLG